MLEVCPERWIRLCRWLDGLCLALVWPSWSTGRKARESVSRDRRDCSHCLNLVGAWTLVGTCAPAGTWVLWVPELLRVPVLPRVPDFCGFQNSCGVPVLPRVPDSYGCLNSCEYLCSVGTWFVWVPELLWMPALLWAPEATWFVWLPELMWVRVLSYCGYLNSCECMTCERQNACGCLFFSFFFFFFLVSTELLWYLCSCGYLCCCGYLVLVSAWTFVGAWFFLKCVCVCVCVCVCECLNSGVCLSLKKKHFFLLFWVPELLWVCGTKQRLSNPQGVTYSAPWRCPTPS